MHCYNSLTMYSLQRGRTPLHRAAEEGDEGTVRVLLGINVDSKDEVNESTKTGNLNDLYLYLSVTTEIRRCVT